MSPNNMSTAISVALAVRPTAWRDRPLIVTLFVSAGPDGPWSRISGCPKISNPLMTNRHVAHTVTRVVPVRRTILAYSRTDTSDLTVSLGVCLALSNAPVDSGPTRDWTARCSCGRWVLSSDATNTTASRSVNPTAIGMDPSSWDVNCTLCGEYWRGAIDGYREPELWAELWRLRSDFELGDWGAAHEEALFALDSRLPRGPEHSCAPGSRFSLTARARCMRCASTLPIESWFHYGFPRNEG